MHFTQLRYFCEVCRQGSVTRAAEALFVSQPTVSVAIRDLETEYGLQLFERDKKRFILTEVGTLFYDKAQKILEMADDLNRQMKNIALKRRSVRVGVSPLSALFVFFPIFHKFHELYPEINLVMCEHGSTDSMNQLEAKQLDFAIVISSSRAEEDFDLLPLVETNMLLCVSRQHRLAGAKSVCFEEIADEKLIMMNSASYQTGAMIQKRFDELGLTPNILLRIDQLEAIKQYIMNYNASAIITSLMCIFVVPRFCPEESSVTARDDLGKELSKSTLSTGKEKLSYIISIGSILLMMTNSVHSIPTVTCAVGGAFLMVLFHVLSDKEAVAAVHWDMIFMFAGILPIATALDNTGASDIVANAIQTLLGGTTNPWVINIAFGLTAWILTQFLSNTAMIAVFTPLALLFCTKFGMNPIGIMGLIYIGSTSSFLTPMATPGIPLIMGAGGYSFKDIFKIGIIPATINIISGIIWCSLAFPAY